MAKQHVVTVNGTRFGARSGQTILDAALTQGVDVPHDCRAGRCGTCVMRLEHGHTLCGEAHQPGMVHACQARVFSDLTLTCEDTLPVVSVEGTLEAAEDLTADVVELTIRTDEPFSWWPGQYARFTFRGFAQRCFSPTVPLDGRAEAGRFRLNVRRVTDGRVSQALGRRIKPGHPVRIEGPFGAAYFRPGDNRRLVLVAGGTGFAPVWAIADAALRENPLRDIVIIAGSRRVASLYMAPALTLAEQMPNVAVVATADDIDADYAALRRGSPDQHLPVLSDNDVVHACGAPAMVTKIADLAVNAGAAFYADPFEASADQEADWLWRAVSWLKAG